MFKMDEDESDAETPRAVSPRVATAAAGEANGMGESLFPHNKQHKFSYKFHLSEGLEADALGETQSTPPRTTVFLGNCHCCGQHGHSQQYCPLLPCATCREYGHNTKACMMSRSL